MEPKQNLTGSTLLPLLLLHYYYDYHVKFDRNWSGSFDSVITGRFYMNFSEAV
jgi:hypothetical protein